MKEAEGGEEEDAAAAAASEAWRLRMTGLKWVGGRPLAPKLKSPLMIKMADNYRPVFGRVARLKSAAVAGRAERAV